MLSKKLDDYVMVAFSAMLIRHAHKFPQKSRKQLDETYKEIAEESFRMGQVMHNRVKRK